VSLVVSCRVVQWEKYVQETLKFMKYVPIMFCSAKTGSHTRTTRHTHTPTHPPTHTRHDTTRHTTPVCWLTNSLRMKRRECEGDDRSGDPHHPGEGALHQDVDAHEAPRERPHATPAPVQERPAAQDPLRHPRSGPQPIPCCCRHSLTRLSRVRWCVCGGACACACVVCGGAWQPR
jgi:hypothetical protein